MCLTQIPHPHSSRALQVTNGHVLSTTSQLNRLKVSYCDHRMSVVRQQFPLTLNEPIATKVVCFSCLLKCLRSLYGKQCGPRLDCSSRSSLFWVHAVCFYTSFISEVRQLFAADKFSRRHFQMHFFLGALRVK